MKLAGHIKVLGGPYVARGPDVAQAWSNATVQSWGQISVDSLSDGCIQYFNARGLNSEIYCYYNPAQWATPYTFYR